MHLLDILSPERIRIPLEATDKEGVLHEMVALAAASDDVTDHQGALTAVLEREQVRSTGIGHGLALPHGKCEAVRRLLLAVGKPARPVPFNSVDGKPVEIVVLLLSPRSETGAHIQALARIARFLTLEPFRRRLLAAGTPEEIYEAFQQQEAEAESLVH